MYGRRTKEIDLLNSLPNFPTSQMLKEITGYNNEINYKEKYVKERGILTNIVVEYSPKDINQLLLIDNVFVASKFNITSSDKKDRVMHIFSESSELIDKWTVKTINYEVECMLYIGED